MSRAAKKAAFQWDDHSFRHRDCSSDCFMEIIDAALAPEREAARRLRDTAFSVLNTTANWKNGDLREAIAHFDAVTENE